MPASLYESNLSLERIHGGGFQGGGGNGSSAQDMEDNRALKLAYELSMLGLDNVPSSMMSSLASAGSNSLGFGSMGPHSPNGGDSSSLNGFGGDCGSAALNINSAAATLAQLEEMKTRKSQNMTECVPVPTSEHVAEIVGRQGKSTFYHIFIILTKFQCSFLQIYIIFLINSLQ